MKSVNFFPNSSNKSILSDLLKGGGTSLFFRFGGVGISYLLVWYITSQFGAEVFGTYTFFVSSITIISIFINFGIDIYALRYSSEFISQKKWPLVGGLTFASFRMVSVFWLVFSFLIFIFSKFISDFFSVEELFVYLLGAIILPLSLLKIVYQFFRSKKMIATYSLFQNVLLSLICLIFLYAASQIDIQILPNNYLPIAAYSASIIILFLAGGILWLKILSKRTSFSDIQKNFIKDERYNFKSLIKNSFPFLLASSIVLVGNQVDQIMIKILDTSEQLGVYMVAYKISQVIAFPLMAINSISAPKFSEYFGANDMEKLEQTAKYTSNLCLFISSIPFLIIMIFPTYLLSIFGEEFVQASNILRLLAFGQYITASFGSVGALLQMTDNQRILNNVGFYTVFLNIILNLILIPLLGIFGAAIASVTALALRNIIYSFHSNKELGFKPVSFI